MSVERPGSVTFASLVGVFFGFGYTMAGVLSFVEQLDTSVVAFFLLVGLPMLIGSLGLLGAKRWAVRWARAGIGFLFAIHACISLLMLAVLIASAAAPTGGAPMSAILVVWSMTALQGLAYWKVRGPDADAYIWAHTEANLETTQHEQLAAEAEGGVTFDYYGGKPQESSAKPETEPAEAQRML